MNYLMQLFYIFFVVSAINVILYFLSLRRLFDLLKNKYPEKYKELGEPSLWWNNSPRNTIRIVAFIFSKDSIFSSDRELSITKNFALLFLCVGIGIFIFLMVQFVLFFKDLTG